MSGYTDPAWDEYLSTGEDPTGGELEGYKEEACEEEPICGSIIDSYYSLVQPEPNWYNWHNQQVHGLGPADTNNARVFSEVWNELSPKIGNLPIVAHNASFDKGCLKDAFKVYGIDWIDNTFYDTLKGSRDYFGDSLPNHQLHTVAAACGYDLRNHHHALADAEACAYIAMTVWEWE